MGKKSNTGKSKEIVWKRWSYSEVFEDYYPYLLGLKENAGPEVKCFKGFFLNDPYREMADEDFFNVLSWTLTQSLFSEVLLFVHQRLVEDFRNTLLSTLKQFDIINSTAFPFSNREDFVNYLVELEYSFREKTDPKVGFDIDNISFEKINKFFLERLFDSKNHSLNRQQFKWTYLRSLKFTRIALECRFNSRDAAKQFKWFVKKYIYVNKHLSGFLKLSKTKKVELDFELDANDQFNNFYVALLRSLDRFKP